MNLLGVDKTTLGTLKATKEVLQQLHEGGHLGSEKDIEIIPAEVHRSTGEDLVPGSHLRMSWMSAGFGL